MMHASIGCSRAVVDAGVLDARFQIGQTGQIVRPKLYLAFGISGASQHIVGMRDAKVVVAINRILMRLFLSMRIIRWLQM